MPPLGLALTNVQPQDAGFVYAYASNSVGVTQSQPAEIRVSGSAPVFVVHPTSQTVSVGSTVTFSAQATGFPEPTYRWWSSSKGQLSSRTGTCVISNVQMEDAGSIYAIASNAVGSTNSLLAELRVTHVMPVFLGYGAPTNTATVLKYLDPLRVTVSASGGDLKYQWVLNGTNINLATNATLYIQHVGYEHSGQYHVVISNGVGQIIGPAFTVLVGSPPVITQSPESQGVQAGSDLHLWADITGTRPFSFQWLFNSVPMAGKNTEILEIPNIQASNQGNYSVRVSNLWGSASSANAFINVVASGPQIKTQPKSQSVVIDQSATISVEVTGSAPMKYQWYHNGALIVGVDSPTLQIQRVSQADVGDYYVVVLNAGGSVTSAHAELSLKGMDRVGMLTIQNVDQGWFKLTLNATPSTEYEIRSSENLVVWRPKYTNVTDLNGTFAFYDGPYTPDKELFYVAAAQSTDSSSTHSLSLTNFLGNQCSYSVNGDKISLSGGWGTFLYRHFTNDFSVIATFVVYANGSATVNPCRGDIGLMVMERPMRGSKNVYLERTMECTNDVQGVGLNESGGCHVLFAREDMGQGESAGSATWNWWMPNDASTPVVHEMMSTSFKLERRGSKFRAYRSPAGVCREQGGNKTIVVDNTGTDGWALFGECDVAMNAKVAAGLYFGEFEGQVNFSEVIFNPIP